MNPDLVYYLSKYFVDTEDKFALSRVNQGWGENVYWTEEELFSPFETACANGDLEKVVELLRVKGLDPALHDNIALRRACVRGQLGVVSVLLRDPRIDPSFPNNKPILDALGVGDIKNLRYDKGRNAEEIAMLLLQDPRVDPSKAQRDDSPVENIVLFFACRFEHYNLVQALLRDPRIDPTIPDNRLIRLASTGSERILLLLLEDGRADPLSDSVFMNACKQHYTQAVTILLKNSKIDPSWPNNEPLYYASERGWSDITALLLKDSRVSPSQPKNLPLLEAGKRGYPAVVEQLLGHPGLQPPSEALVDKICTEFIGKAEERTELGRAQVVLQLIHDPRVTFSPTAFLHCAGQAPGKTTDAGQPYLLKIILEHGRVDPNIINFPLYVKNTPAVDRRFLKGKYFERRLACLTLLLEDPRLEVSVENNLALSNMLDAGMDGFIELLTRHPRFRSPY